MNKSAQIQKAEAFLKLHHDSKILVLPNIWDPLGARLLEKLGYPAVATASAAVAFSLGYDDGQKISFDTMLETVARIAASVKVPMTADIEGGYATEPEAVAENIRKILHAGAVGINFEDSTSEGGPLHPIDFQCARIQAIRNIAQKEGIPLVINARTDVFIRRGSDTAEEKLEETITRAKAYLDAGADSIYPIILNDADMLRKLYEKIKAPINVYAMASTPPMRELEKMGISRLSLGPGLIKASLTTMKRIAMELQNYGSYDLFTKNMIPSEEVKEYVRKDKMPG